MQRTAKVGAQMQVDEEVGAEAASWSQNCYGRMRYGNKYEGAAKQDDENANLEERVAMVAAVLTPRDPRHRKHVTHPPCIFVFGTRESGRPAYAPGGASMA